MPQAPQSMRLRLFPDALTTSPDLNRDLKRGAGCTSRLSTGHDHPVIAADQLRRGPQAALER